MKFYVNLRYLIVPISSLVTILGILFRGIYAWTGVFLFGIYTIIDTVTKKISTSELRKMRQVILMELNYFST